MMVELLSVAAFMAVAKPGNSLTSPLRADAIPSTLRGEGRGGDLLGPFGPGGFRVRRLARILYFITTHDRVS